ncbi:MAG: hypothetical protein V4660_14505 [Pseudomonadota bacterium]
MYNTWIASFAGVLLLFSGANYASAQPQKQLTASSTLAPITVRYLATGDLHSIEIYKYELIHRALELTRVEFGDYKNIPYQGANASQQRRANLISEGKILNLDWASPGTPVAKAEVIPIAIDILNGLLGYRVCLINTNAPLKINDVSGMGSLTMLKIGQSELWSDIEIYRNNNINPILGPTFSSLFDMLGFKRFDCLPLGVNEIILLFNEKKVPYPFLAIDTQLLIYYDFPMYFYVSKTQPLLAKRLQLGFTKMQQSGEFNQLFKQYHPQDLSPLNLRSRKVICLKSPFMDQTKQCTQPLKYPD